MVEVDTVEPEVAVGIAVAVETVVAAAASVVVAAVSDVVAAVAAVPAVVAADIVAAAVVLVFVSTDLKQSGFGEQISQVQEQRLEPQRALLTVP